MSFTDETARDTSCHSGTDSGVVITASRLQQLYDEADGRDGLSFRSASELLAAVQLLQAENARLRAHLNEKNV